VRPRVSIKDDSGKTAGAYLLPAGANIMFAEGDTRGPRRRDRPRSARDHEDQGTSPADLPRVAELFEARKAKEQAVDQRDQRPGRPRRLRPRAYRKVMVEGEGGLVKEYLIPRASR